MGGVYVVPEIRSILFAVVAMRRHVRSYSRFNVFIVLKDIHVGYRQRIELTSLLYPPGCGDEMGWDGIPAEQFNVRNGCSLVFT